MAHFIGSVQGQRGEASRLGGKKSGLTAYAASWQGGVRVSLYHDETTGKDRVCIALAKHWGAGVNKVLFEGPVDGEVAS